MQLLEDGIIAALAAIGLVTLLFLVISAFVRPRCRAALDAVAVVPCHGGDCAKLEHTVHMLERTRYEYGGFCRIVILDCGLDEEAKQVAALLCKEDYDVALCGKSALLETLGADSRAAAVN